MYNPNFDPEEALPPGEVRIETMEVEPWPDGRRVRILVNLTPFQKQPNLEAKINDSQGAEVTSITIIEVMDPSLVFTMHLRVPDPQGKYNLHVQLAYESEGRVDERTLAFEVHPQTTPDA